MKQRIDLYLLAQDTFEKGFGFVCSLVEKAVLQKHAPVIRLESESAAKMLDEMLWSFRDTSFVPHEREGADSIHAGRKQGIPLLVLCRLMPNPEDLKTLSGNRLLQIVPNQPNLLQLARQHYRFYQQQGCQITTHQIK